MTAVGVARLPPLPQGYRVAVHGGATKASPAAAAASQILSTAGAALSEYDSKQLLAAYGIPTTRDAAVHDRRCGCAGGRAGSAAPSS